ncbi:hypothetical protein PoB_007241100 [Plakobranchus ocellatus]|uniref:Uncharacterized protein n=1 Tax=Plakobranchus ocellatus TaxID=259542 RepID=A0AAV4DP59_9GAST|nr:hypothetical protein PoB_007241100 [Plakobranchus ocellatus]
MFINYMLLPIVVASCCFLTQASQLNEHLKTNGKKVTRELFNNVAASSEPERYELQTESLLRNILSGIWQIDALKTDLRQDHDSTPHPQPSRDEPVEDTRSKPPRIAGKTWAPSVETLSRKTIEKRSAGFRSQCCYVDVFCYRGCLTQVRHRIRYKRDMAGKIFSRRNLK